MKWRELVSEFIEIVFGLASQVSYGSMQFKFSARRVLEGRGKYSEHRGYTAVKVDMGMFNFPLLLSLEPSTLCSSGSENAQLLLSARTRMLNLPPLMSCKLVTLRGFRAQAPFLSTTHLEQ